jgi:hypothetical protein
MLDLIKIGTTVWKYTNKKETCSLLDILHNSHAYQPDNGTEIGTTVWKYINEKDTCSLLDILHNSHAYQPDNGTEKVRAWGI